MSINIDALFQHLMEDPDLIPPEGEEKEDIAMAMATQRAKQSKNNVKALNMAKEDRTISMLLAFLKAEEDDSEAKENKDYIETFNRHERNFILHEKKILAAAKTGSSPWMTRKQSEAKNARENKRKVETVERPDEQSFEGKVHQQQWEAAYEFLNLNASKIIDKHEERMALRTAGGQEAEGDPEEEAPAEAPEEPQPTRAQRAGVTPDEEERAAGEARRQSSPEKREADRARRLKAAKADEKAGTGDYADKESHHSLTSAVDVQFNAKPDVELDRHGNDPDSPFHQSRFGDNVAAFDRINTEYTKEDLEEALDHHEKRRDLGGAGRSLHSLNIGGAKGGSLEEKEVHDMMDRFFESQGRQEGTSYVVPGQRTAPAMFPVKDTAASDWYIDNIPDKGADATAWDQYVQDNFPNFEDADEHVLNDHLHAFLKGRDQDPSTPPKAQATTQHIEADAQKQIVIASQSDDPKHEIEAKLSEHQRAVIDNPVLTPHQQKLMIDAANELGEIAAKKVSTEENKIVITPIDPVETSEAILDKAAQIHIETEANGETEDEKAEAAQKVHDATLIHEKEGGDAEAVLKDKGVRYKKLDNGQYHFQGGSKVWGDLANRDAIGQTPEGEPEPSTETPEAHDERQGAFDFDAPRQIEVTPPPEGPPDVQIRPEDDAVDWDNLNEAERNSVTDNGGIETDDGFIDAPQHILERHGFEGEVPKIEVAPPRKPMTAAARKHLEDNGINPDDPDSTFSEQLAQIRTKKEAEALVAQNVPEAESEAPSDQSASYRHQLPTKQGREEMARRIKEGEEAEGRELTSPEKAAIRDALANVTPEQLDDLDALKMGHDELVQEFQQLQTDEDEANQLPDKTKKEKRDKAAEIKRVKREKAKVSKAGKEQQAKIAAKTEEVEPTEETSEEAPQAEPKPEPEEREAEPADAAPPEAGDPDAQPVDEPAPRDIPRQQGLQGKFEQIDEDEEGEVEEPTDDVDPRQGRFPGFGDEEGEAPAEEEAVARTPRERRPRRGQQRLPESRRRPTETTAQPARSEAQAKLDDAGVEEDTPEGQVGPRAGGDEKVLTALERAAIRTRMAKRDFLRANKMSPEVLNDLSDDQMNEEYGKLHKKLSDKAMSDHLAGKPDKEEILEAMAKAHERVLPNGEADPDYLRQLREEHKFASPEELVKEHKAIEKDKAANKFEHAKNEANSSALNMDELPEEGLDKLHAMDRARDIAKKLNDSNMAVKKGGKPLLDSNAMSHLKDLMDDAVNKGDLQQDDIDGIAKEAHSMGENYLNDEHQASIAGDNEIKRAHHEEFRGHAEDMSEAALQRRGHDLDHSKAHELHDYETNEDGTIGARTGSSHHVREEDGSVGHQDGAGNPASADNAVEGMEAQHPPKLLGLNPEEQIEQKEHFDLMKKAAAGELEPGDYDKFKSLEAKNPKLADPSYKGQVLGAVRHQLSREGGEDKMSAMGIDGKDQDAAAEGSCKPPPGVMPPGGDKGWNPDTHRWCDKEYLESIKGQLGPGEASYHPDGLHAGTENAHLDQDADGNVQGVMVTPTGVHKVTPTSGGDRGMKSPDGGAVNHADVLGHHLAGHAGGKVDKDTLHAMGMNHSEKHTGKGQKRGDWDPKVLTDVSGTPGARMFQAAKGKLGRMLQGNREREQGRPNATGTDRQRARRGTEGSPASSFLSRLGTHTKESLKDAAEELPAYAGGNLLREGQQLPFGGGKVGGTDRYQDKQVRQAADRVQKRQSASAKLTERINRVMGEGSGGGPSMTPEEEKAMISGYYHGRSSRG